MAIRRAQISIEFLTILSLFLLIFLGVSLNLIQLATNNMNNVYDIVVWKSNKIVLKEANDFALYSGGGKIVYLYKPGDCTMSISGSSVCLDCGKTIKKNCFTGSPNVQFTPLDNLNKNGTVVIKVNRI